MDHRILLTDESGELHVVPLHSFDPYQNGLWNGLSTITYTEVPDERRPPMRRHARWENPWEVQDEQQQLIYVYPAGSADEDPTESSLPMPPIPVDDDSPVGEPIASVPVRQVRRHEAPPPIDLDKSLYTCVGLPEVVDEPVVLNKALEFSRVSYDPRIIYAECPPIDGSNHVCEPATYPSLQSMVVIYPTGRPLTVVPADKERNEVTVGDVLRAIDKEYFKKYTELAGHEMNPEFDVNGVPICECLGILTALMHLRSLYVMGGLVRTHLGHDIWALKLGDPQ